jgi:glycosyltransferase involved in cell wall biosynthesis
MKLQVLIATMHQVDFAKANEMKITSDAVFANQGSFTNYQECRCGENVFKMISTTTRGVGINRNLSLMYSDGDILLFADDDLKYVDGYENIVLDAFKKYPKADAFIFNIDTVGEDMNRRVNKKMKRVHFYNSLNYGAVRIAVRRNCILSNGIMFNLNFGGGTKYSSGEDTLFICDMLRAGLKIYTYPYTIASVDQTTSTWFNGYTNKYFYDKGALFFNVSRRFKKILMLQDIIRHYSLYKVSGMSRKSIYKLMMEGAKKYSILCDYDAYVNTVK